jgi:hypothetical protein
MNPNDRTRRHAITRFAIDRDTLRASTTMNLAGQNQCDPRKTWTPDSLLRRHLLSKREADA